jgi:hypothetical protein
MRSVVWFMREGGAMMWLILLLAVPATIAAILGLALGLGGRGTRAALGFGVGLAAAGVLLVACGAGGYAWGMSRVEAALAGVSPEHRVELYAVGQREASNNLTFGAGAAALPLLAGATLLAVGLARRKQAAAAPQPMAGMMPPGAMPPPGARRP